MIVHNQVIKFGYLYIQLGGGEDKVEQVLGRRRESTHLQIYKVGFKQLSRLIMLEHKVIAPGISVIQDTELSFNLRSIRLEHVLRLTAKRFLQNKVSFILFPSGVPYYIKFLPLPLPNERLRREGRLQRRPLFGFPGNP